MPHPLSATRFLLGCLLLLALAPGAQAAQRRALILVGLSTSDTQAARLREAADSVHRSFLRRGLHPDSVSLLAHQPAHPLRRDAILAALSPSPSASPDDESWLILLGTSAPDRNGLPAFQISGPRLNAHDLAQALAALPGKKFVVLATSASGGFLPPLLALPDIEAVAATAEAGQINEPRFPAF